MRGAILSAKEGFPDGAGPLSQTFQSFGRLPCPVHGEMAEQGQIPGLLYGGHSS